MNSARIDIPAMLQQKDFQPLRAAIERILSSMAGSDHNWIHSGLNEAGFKTVAAAVLLLQDSFSGGCTLHSEVKCGKGHADLVLTAESTAAPSTNRSAAPKHKPAATAVIECKYTPATFAGVTE